jgi:hypothetical protein
VGGTDLLQKNFAASGPIVAPGANAGNVKIYGVTCDVAGTVTITDGLGKVRLALSSPAGGVVMLNPNYILCQQGATLTLTGVTNCGLFYAT